MFIQAYGRRLRSLLFGGWLFRGVMSPAPSPGPLGGGICTIQPFSAGIASIQPFTGGTATI